MRKIVLKEGPMVFLRNLLFMEVLATLFFFAISFLENYEMLFKRISLFENTRYDLFIIASFSVFQVIYILIIFLGWYFTSFEITEKEIVKRTGLFFKSRKSVQIANVVSVEIHQSPFDRLIQHATIILDHQNGRITKINNLSDYEESVSFIKHILDENHQKNNSLSIDELLKRDEGETLEFKESLRVDTKTNNVNKEIEKSSLKTIVGFLNAKGGTLLIGISDSGEVKGLERDYKSLPKKNKDGFENHLSMLIKTMIGFAYRGYVKIRFTEKDKCDIAIVEVSASHKPAYLHFDQKEEFYVRSGNGTQPLTLSDMEVYIRDRWK